MSAPDLAALVSARLCHDLISPMGAIGNGLELLQLSDGAASPELALVNESLATALAKLRFFRIAFGPADVAGRQSFDEAAQVTDGMFHGRFTVAWSARGRDMARPLARVVYLALLCLEKSLPMGGLVRIEVEAGSVRLAVEARRIAPPALLWAHVTDAVPVEALSSDVVQFALLARALAQTGQSLGAVFGDDAITLWITEADARAEARPGPAGSAAPAP